jgi:AcrR family transcriptional regulator
MTGMAHAYDRAAAPQPAAVADQAGTTSEDQAETTAAGTGRRRRSRDRARTEADLLEAAFELLQRDGVFAGLNLQEVAERAGVNRGQIYQYFGDRRSLLRSAVAYHAREWAAGAKRHWEMPFAKRRRAMFSSALASPEVTRVEALLAIDGDSGYHAMPEIERTKTALERDLRSGDLPADSDAVALHALMVAAYKGYIIFREALARDIGVPVEQLDARVLAAQDQMLEILARAAEPANGEPKPNSSQPGD